MDQNQEMAMRQSFQKELSEVPVFSLIPAHSLVRGIITALWLIDCLLPRLLTTMSPARRSSTLLTSGNSQTHAWIFSQSHTSHLIFVLCLVWTLNLQYMQIRMYVCTVHAASGRANALQ